MLKTLNNAIQVLNCFTDEKYWWGVRELSRELNTSHTIISRILKTFEKNGFVKQNLETQKYCLGFKFIEFNQIIQKKMSITEELLPIMRTISNKTNESIFLTWKENNEGVTLAIAESEERIKFSVSVGTRTPLHVGASCKSIMAFLTDKEKNQIINEYTQLQSKFLITNTTVILDELNEIKNQGWVYTSGEYSDRVFGLSAPLFNKMRQPVASITIAGPEYRVSDDKREKMLNILKEETENIQRIIYDVI